MKTSIQRRIPIVSLAACFLGATPLCRGATINSTYTGNGPDDEWSTASNWDPTQAPLNNGTDEFIVTIPPASGQVLMGQNTGVTGLTIGTGSNLHIVSGNGLFPNDEITNNGLITFSPNVGQQRIQTSFGGSISFVGTGTVRSVPTTFGSIIGQNGTNSLTNGSAHTIEGHGAFGQNIESITNRGVISANITGETLHVNSFASAVDLDGGEFRAESGGTLLLDVQSVDGQNGALLTIGDDSQITINGGTVSNATIRAIDPDGDLANNRLVVGQTISIADVINEARIELSDASNSQRLNVTGALVNEGEIFVRNEGGGASGISISGESELPGSGKIILTDAGSHELVGSNGVDSLVHRAGHSIEGAGMIRAIESFTNEGTIHANRGDVFVIAAGLGDDFFANEPSGILRVTNSSELRIPAFGVDGLTFANRGLIDVEAGSFLDASQNPTLGNIERTDVTMEETGNLPHFEAELRVNGIFETDNLDVSSGLISGGGMVRTKTSILDEGVVIRPDGVLTFADTAPTAPPPFPCLGFGTGPGNDLPLYSDVVQLGGSTLDLDIESPTVHDEIRFGASALPTGVHAIGSIRLKLNFVGDPGDFSPTDRLTIVSRIGFLADFAGPGPGERLVRCPEPDGPQALVHPQVVGGLTVANLPAGGRLSTFDGRANFKVELITLPGAAGATAEKEIVLSEPFFAAEVPAQNYDLDFNAASGVGGTVATIAAPAGITGTPTFAIVGETPFEIDPDTGVITLVQPLDPRVTNYNVTVNVFDGDNVQINPTTITITPAPQFGDAQVTPAAPGQPATYTVEVVDGGPNHEARLQASLDLGITDPWTDLATIILDASGRGTFANVQDARAVAEAAKTHFVRVVTTPPAP